MEGGPRWSARDSIVVSDRLLQVIVLFCFIFSFVFWFSFRWTTVPSKRIIYAHRNRASIYSRSPDHRMNFAIPATFEGVLPSHSACIHYRRVKLLGNITECKVMFDITHYRRTTSTGNNPMMCVYMVKFVFHLEAGWLLLPSRVVSRAGWIVYIRTLQLPPRLYR